MVIVYVWHPRVLDSLTSGVLGQDVGHSSMQVANTYISFIPANGVNKNSVNSYVKSSFVDSLDEDIKTVVKR